MRKISKVIIALWLALLMAALLPVQVFAASPKYISEVKIGMGATVKEAEKALKDYTILKYNGKYADLNEDAAPVVSSGYEEEKVVLLGYKTTYSKDDAITDLAVMNMEGDYFDYDYNMVIDQVLQGEIVPFLRDFIVAIQEYKPTISIDGNFSASLFKALTAEQTNCTEHGT